MIEYFEIPSQVLKIMDKLPNAYIVGGFVRDSLIGISYNDIDITTSATPDQIKKIFPKHTALGEKFGTIIIQEGNLKMEVTTMRIDKTSGRHPKVSFTDDIYKDLSRRDFTINAMALNREGLFDPFGGKLDIRGKTIKAVGNPALRMDSDPLRAIIAMKLSSKLDFQIANSLKEAIKRISLTETHPEAIRTEFLKSLSYNPVKTVLEMIELKMEKFILPNLHLLEKCEQLPKYHPEGNALNHTLTALSLPGTTTNQKMAILLHDTGKMFIKHQLKYSYHGHEKKSVEYSKKILKHLKFSNKDIEEILFAVENHMKMHNIKEMRKSKRYAFYAMPYFQTLLKVHEADTHGRENNVSFVLSDIPEEREEPLIKGKYLIEIGFKPSKELRYAKEKLYTLQIEENLTENELKEKAKSIIRRSIENEQQNEIQGVLKAH